MRWRRALIWGIPAGICLIWLGYVTGAGQWERVVSHWEASVMMVFGSFVAGSTPQGGGAVAFPVLTKGLGVSAPVARTFSLSVQAIGMTTASLIILLARRPIVTKVVLTAAATGVVGFLFTLFFLSDHDALWWPAMLPGPYVKVTFTIVLAAMSFIVYLSLRNHDKGSQAMTEWNPRVWTGLILAGFLGGMASALTGSGVDVLVFLFAVTMCGLHPRVGVPTSIVAMAAISVVGLISLGVYDGQLFTQINAGGDVISVGGSTVSALPGSQFDVLGLWLASIPLIVWGAPLGAWAASVMTENRLIAFVAAMAALEVLSTAVFLDELRSDVGLVAYAVIGLAVALALVSYLVRNRHRVFDLSVPA